MSELKDRWFWAYPTESVDCDGITGSAHEVYSKSDVDASIDELKAAHHKERHEYIKMIAELKQKLQDQCISCPVKMQEDDVVAEKDDEIRRLKRALYKACANWAHHRVFVRFKTNEMAWENVERKCRAKAEENK